jgi:hypothetical protein
VRDDPEVEALLADHSDAVVATVHTLRAVLLDAQPQLQERAQRGWHSLNYRDPAAGFVCALFPTADRVQLIFERGVDLPDPERRLSGSGRRVRTLAFEKPEDVDPEVVTTFLDLAVDLGAALRAR